MEKSKKEKKEKREKKESKSMEGVVSEDIEDIFDISKAKDDKKKKKRDTEDADGADVKPKSKKAKRTDEDVEDSTSAKSGNEQSSSSKKSKSEQPVELLPRQRTRSLSNAEEHYPPAQSPEEFRKQHSITILGNEETGSRPYESPPPMTSFASTPFAQPIRRALDAAGFPNPTPTQAQAWPIALQGRDVITVAKTGSGKTCGFLLPAFHRLLADLTGRKRGPPGILVLAPTRELACQIEEECVKFGRTSNIRSTCAYGGAPKSMQIRKIQAGLEVLIATPGRLNDLIEMGAVHLNHVLFLVLDEADRM